MKLLKDMDLLFCICLQAHFCFFSFCQLLVTQIKMEIVNFLSLIINKIIQIYRQLLLLLSSVQFSLAMAASGFTHA